MKMKLAIYTAQEGYSWQPGTAFTAEELVAFKKSIGKFPSPDSMDFPFGGIFLLEDRVVFYRYHVAKKIDFRGRDALYCVLGAVSREEAAKIDPPALFACPEFAGPMKPFPTELELPEADSSAVPEWLKNLDKMTLDVRITGAAGNPSYAVVQNPIEVPHPPAPEPPPPDTTDTPSTNPSPIETPPAPDGMAQSPSAPQCYVPDSPDGRARSPSAPQCGVPESPDGRARSPSAPQMPRRLICLIAAAAAMAVLLIGGSLWFVFGKKQEGAKNPNGKTELVSPTTNDVVTAGAPADTNNLPDVSISTNGIPPVTNVVDVSANTSQSVTNVSAAVTNTVPVLKDVPAPTKEKKAANPKEGKPVQKKNVAAPKSHSTAVKKAVPQKNQPPKGKMGK